MILSIIFFAFAALFFWLGTRKEYVSGKWLLLFFWSIAFLNLLAASFLLIGNHPAGALFETIETIEYSPGYQQYANDTLQCANYTVGVNQETFCAHDVNTTITGTQTRTTSYDYYSNNENDIGYIFFLADLVIFGLYLILVMLQILVGYLHKIMGEGHGEEE